MAKPDVRRKSVAPEERARDQRLRPTSEVPGAPGPGMLPAPDRGLATGRPLLGGPPNAGLRTPAAPKIAIEATFAVKAAIAMVPAPPSHWTAPSVTATPTKAAAIPSGPAPAGIVPAILISAVLSILAEIHRFVRCRAGPGRLNNFSASISGASAGVRLPSGGAAG